MRTIQDVGLEIAEKKLSKFYVFLGPEYGIKCKYLDMISEVYSGNIVEADSVKSTLDLMKQKHLIPLRPALYICRYDTDFVSSLSATTYNDIKATKIIGTIVCLYEEEKLNSKFDKYLGDYSVVINSVTDDMEMKYLTKDFPNLPDRFKSVAIKGSVNYGQAQSLCKAISSVPLSEFNDISDYQLLKLFGYENNSTDEQLKVGIASKNMKYLINVVDNYQGDLDDVVYAVLSTMVELDKIQSSRYSDSNLKKYAKAWSGPDIYYMFNHAYSELKNFRTLSVDKYARVTYLISLLGFSHIPSTKEV